MLHKIKIEKKLIWKKKNCPHFPYLTFKSLTLPTNSIPLCFPSFLSLNFFQCVFFSVNFCGCLEQEPWRPHSASQNFLIFFKSNPIFLQNYTPRPSPFQNLKTRPANTPMILWSSSTKQPTTWDQLLSLSLHSHCLSF